LSKVNGSIKPPPDGMAAVIYYSDEAEEFEWDGRLWRRPTGPEPAPQWMATVDDQSFHRLC